MRTARQKPDVARKDFVAALESGLKVIETFGPEHPRLTLSDVARQTGLSRAAARRYLLTLSSLGYAGHDGKHFWLTPRVLRLGHAQLSSTPLPQLAQPVLESVGQATGEVASIAVLDGSEVVFLARSQTRRIVSASVSVGTRLPVYCTSTGKVLLAALPEREMRHILERLRPVRHTPRTKTRREDLLQAIRDARSNGYAVSDEEYEIGLRSISVPVYSASGTVAAAMSASTQSGRMTVEQMIRDLLPPLHRASRLLSQML